MEIDSCGAGSNDRFEELSGGYYYTGEGGNSRMIWHQSDKKNSAIYSAVIDFVFDDNFILAEQHPQYKSHVSALADDIWDHQGDITIYYKRADSILQNDEKYKKIFQHEVNYWIIAVKEDTLIGPLTMNEYSVLRKRLAIPSSLRLEVEK